MSEPTEEPMASVLSSPGALVEALQRLLQVEIDEHCRRVLANHWPEVPKHDDVRTVADWWSGERPPVHVVAGGFPCQPFSLAGRKRGVADERWGWPWMADVIRLVRPQYVFVENVSDLARDSDAFGWLLGDLCELGFDAEWSIVSACSVGAPHPRQRMFLVAYPNGFDGRAWMGAVTERRREWSIQDVDGEAGAWRDRVDGAVAASRADDRETDGSARWMVKAGGNAVVPQVAEYVGRLIVNHASVAVGGLG